MAAAQGVDIAVESLHTGWVETAGVSDRSALGLDQALVGDTIRVSATVKNLGLEAASQFNVDFFFTETVSGEHGKIGSQAVIGLEPGESRRPVVTFDSTAFAPGVYIFSAEADPERANTESERCNNFAPLGDCAGSSAQSDDRYKLTLLQAGSHLSELTLRTEFEILQMGALTTTLIVDAHNVGTEAFSSSDLDVYGYYRLSLDPPANEFISLSEDNSGTAQPLSKIVSLSTPGDEGFIRITLDYSELSNQFQPSDNAIESGEVLGRATLAQIRISIDPLGGGSPQDLYLPEQFSLSHFYSEVDLWTFPQRSPCQCDDYTDIETLAIDPAVAGGLVFQAVRASGGDRLHVLKIRSGEEKPNYWEPPSGVSIVAVAAVYDEDAGAYSAYVAADDGKVYSLEGADKETGSFLTQSWISGSGLVSGPAYLDVSTEGNLVIIGSEAGAYVLDALDGSILRSDTTHDVTTRPVYGNTSGTLWFASDEIIYGLRADGTECSNDEIQDQITSNLLMNADETAVFFGTDSGDFFAVDGAASGTTCSILAQQPALVRLTLVGADLVSDGRDAVIYVVDSIGNIALVNYDHGDGFDFRDDDAAVDSIEPRSIGARPAILPASNGRDAAVVFVTGQIRDGRDDRPMLQGMDTDLEEFENVSVWGTSVPFVFKPEEGDAIPSALLTPIVDLVTDTLLVASSDGYLYAFDLSQFE